MFSNDYITANGVEHFVVEYEAQNASDAPVLLYVHGGPGLAESLLAWEVQARTLDLFHLVFFDARGAGRTFYKSPDGLVTEEEIEKDLAEIADYYVAKFNQKIVLMAHNFGTVAAIRYARLHPEKVQAYIGYEQIADMTNVNAIRFARVKELALLTKHRRDVKTVDKLAALTNGTFEKELLKKNQVTKLNVLLNKYNVASGTDKELMKHIPKSPLYDGIDLRAMMNAPRLSYKLNRYMKTVNLYDEPLDYQVPVCFISGDWDYQYPYKTAQEYLEKITAPYKEMVLIKDAGCYAMFDAPDEFWDAVVKFVYRDRKEKEQ